MTGNVFSHQFQGGRVTATVLSPSTEKKSLGVDLRVAFLPCRVDWTRSTGRAGLGSVACAVEEADAATYMCEVSAPRVRVLLAKTLALLRASNLELLGEEIALAHLPRES